MDLIINTYGTKIGSSGERIVLTFPDASKKEYPIRHLEKILILRPSSLTTHAVKLALEHEVDIVYLGDFNKPVGRVFSSEPKGLAQLRRAQLSVSTSDEAFSLAKIVIKGKCSNQIDFLRYLGYHYDIDVNTELIQATAMLDSLNSMTNQPKNREQLLGVEGYIADRYFAGLRKFFVFPGRKPGGRDKFNSALNYGYGILYNEIDRLCLYVGLDPYLGLHHSERYGKPSLVLDLVEEFRVPIVDMAILPLFIERKIKPKHFQKVSRGIYQLSNEGKALVVSAVFKQLNTISTWHTKKYPLKAIMENQVRLLARYFLGKEKTFTTFSIKTLLQNHE